MNRLKRPGMKMLAVMLLFMVTVNGCGNTDSAKQSTAIEDDAVGAKAKTDTKKEVENYPADSAEEIFETEENSSDPAEESFEFKYIELTEIEDYNNDKSMYQVYAPKGNTNANGFLYYYDHGLTFSASTHNIGFDESPAESLESWVAIWTDGWSDDPEYLDFEISEVLENGKDRYQIITAKRADIFRTPYEVNEIFYMNIQETGYGVLWNLHLSELGMDTETDSIIDELAACYDIDLDVIKPAGEWAVANEERLNRKHTAESLPETILWFNATYAPLTYSNKCDWEVVGGMEPSEYNKKFNQKMLSRDWGIEDADSAIETIENLKENGHRAKCRECMEKLEELGILDEKDEETFLQALLDSGIEDYFYRYVIAYLMHQNGLDADYIAAWDLCRVNQLYADFYLCGYMTYEEAMDASLENSSILQQMYSSWEDMVNAYLLGYQFWRSDPVMTDDSPTLQRYQCYLDLLEMENGPYTLDWNMELQKSW